MPTRPPTTYACARREPALLQGDVHQLKLGPRLAKRLALQLKLLLFALQHGGKLLGLLGLLLCTVQLTLHRFEAHLCLVHLFAKALHYWAQVLVLLARHLVVGVKLGDEVTASPHSRCQNK